jgi:hypothetical protein
MDKVIIYVDDAAYAQQVLTPLLLSDAPPSNHWVLVACAPRMTHRVSKWVSHRARETWRDKWAARLFELLLPWLQIQGATVTPLLAKGPLAEIEQELQSQQLAPIKVVDARKPRAQGATPSAPGTLWSGLVTSLGVMLVAVVD